MGQKLQTLLAHGIPSIFPISSVFWLFLQKSRFQLDPGVFFFWTQILSLSQILSLKIPGWAGSVSRLFVPDLGLFPDLGWWWFFHLNIGEGGNFPGLGGALFRTLVQFFLHFSLIRDVFFFSDLFFQIWELYVFLGLFPDLLFPEKKRSMGFKASGW